MATRQGYNYGRYNKSSWNELDYVYGESTIAGQSSVSVSGGIHLNASATLAQTSGLSGSLTQLSKGQSTIAASSNFTSTGIVTGKH